MREVEHPSIENSQEEGKLAVLELSETHGRDGDHARHVFDGEGVEVAKDGEDSRGAANPTC